MDSVARLIKRELHKLIIDDIKYEKITGKEYEMRLFEKEEITSYLNNLVEFKKRYMMLLSMILRLRSDVL